VTTPDMNPFHDAATKACNDYNRMLNEACAKAILTGTTQAFSA
jgi:hypothetical protein